MPAISPERLVERLAKGKTLPVVLLLGSDAYLREACRNQIVEIAVDPGTRDWGVARFSAEDDELGRGLSQAQTVPMLARRQVVIVSDLEAVEQQSESKREAAIEELGAYLRDPAPFTTLILEASSLDKRMRLAKLLGETALVVAAELPEEPRERLRAAAGVAAQLARDRKVSLDAQAAEELADLCNANLAAIRTEIEKLTTYVGPGQPIGRADVEALVVSEKKYSVWQLSDMLAMRQRAKALEFLDNLLREGEAAPALVGAMAWMYRKLIEAQELGPHASGWQAAGRLGMRPATAEMAVRQAQKIPRRQLLDGLVALYEADSRLKSGSTDDRVLMEFLVARLMVGGTKPHLG